MIQYQFFPRSLGITPELEQIINIFKEIAHKIGSESHELKSNEVLKLLQPLLESIGYRVESGKGKGEKIDVPVLFGQNNSIDKSFYADALSKDGRIVLEVEAGRAIDNNQFLKDIFQACMMCNVEYLILAVRNTYRSKPDYDNIRKFLETLYISGRIMLPLKGILLIGY